MSTNHPYQVMPKLSPEDRAALEASIAADGVRVPIDVDEAGTILDGHQRQEISDQLGRECPKRVITGLTEAQKLEYAYQVNVARRQLRPAQKRQLAEKLWRDGQTQERIAQLLGVSQSTIGNWLQQFTNSGKLPPSPTVQGKDGKQYPRTKTRRGTTHPTEDANGPETSQSPSDAGAGLAQAPEHQETPQPGDTSTKAQAPSSEPPVAADAPELPEAPPPITDELQTAAREQPCSVLGSGPMSSAEGDATARWVGALQDFAVRLETLQMQGCLLSLNRRWASEARVRGMATIRRIQEICRELEAVIEADMDESAARNNHDVGATPFPFLPPIADAAQAQGNSDLVTMSLTEDLIGELSDGDQFPFLGGGEVSLDHEHVVSVQEEAKASTPELPQAPSKPARTRTRRSNQASANGQGSGAPEQMAQDHTTPNASQSNGDGKTIGHPALDHDKEAVAPAASAVPDIDVSARIDHGHSVLGDPTRCGYCGETQCLSISEETGKIFCKCDSVYRPSTGRWHWRRESQPPSLPASVPTTAA